jgi:hypothetical protein
MGFLHRQAEARFRHASDQAEALREDWRAKRRAAGGDTPETDAMHARLNELTADAAKAGGDATEHDPRNRWI